MSLADIFGFGGNGTERVTIDIDDSRGEPVAGASVQITDDGTGAVAGTFTSNADGKVIVKLDPGVYSIVASHPNYEFTNPSTLTVEDV